MPLVDDLEVDLPPILFNSMSNEIQFPVPVRVIGGLERLRLTMQTPTPALPPETASEVASLDSATRSSDNSREEESDAEGVPRRRVPTFPKRTP